MALVHVEITIDEEKLSERAARFQEKCEAQVYQYYCELSLLAVIASTRGGGPAALARIYFILDNCIKYLYNKYKKRQEEREEDERFLLKHTILCGCNRHNCPGYTPSLRTYARKMKAVQ